MKLSSHFSLEEFLINKSELKLNPSSLIISNLKKLCLEVLEPIREKVKKPIIITSGLRSKELNKKVGGVEGSLHLEGLACDFVISGFFLWEASIRIYQSESQFKKLIIYPDENRFHVEALRNIDVIKKEIFVKWDKSETYFNLTELFREGFSL